MLRLTENFKNATLKKGEQFMIELSHNQASGYVWSLSFDPSSIMKLSENFIPDDANEMQQIKEILETPTPLLPKKGSRKRREVVAHHPICHGQLQIVFEAVTPGEFEIKACHEKPDHKLADRYRTFRLTVTN